MHTLKCHLTQATPRPGAVWKSSCWKKAPTPVWRGEASGEWSPTKLRHADTEDPETNLWREKLNQTKYGKNTDSSGEMTTLFIFRHLVASFSKTWWKHKLTRKTLWGKQLVLDVILSDTVILLQRI